MASLRRVHLRSVVCMLLLAYAGAEMYDDAHGIPDLEFIYQDYNYMDPALSFPGYYQEPALDFMMRKLLRSIRPHYTPIAESLPGSTDDRSLFTEGLIEEPVKRLTQAVPNVANSKIMKPVQLRQPKGKVRKGRNVGSHMLCFFKLCAFRAP